jgi:flagellar motor protein MotB
MPNLRRALSRSARLPISLIAGACALVLSSAAAPWAFPRIDQIASLPGVLAIDEPRAGEATAPFAELNEALAAARSRLEELSRAAELMGARAELERATKAAQAESQRLSQELRASRQEQAEWARQHAAGEARIAALSQEIEAAQAKAQRLDQETIALRWRNAQLETSLGEAEAARDAAEREARTLAARLEQLRDAGSQVAGLRQELAVSRGQLERAHAGLAEAEQAREASHAERATLAAEVERLDAELAAAQVEVERVTATNQELAAEVAALDAAANAATEAARQNLIAFEARIRELHAALGPVAAAHPVDADQPAGDAAAPRADPTARSDEDGAPAVSGARLEAVPLPPPPRDQLRQVERSTPAHIQEDLRVIKAAHLAERGALHTIAQDTALLSRETQLQVENLLADLKAEADDRGLRLTVPGAELFAVNSEYIEPSAHDALAKLAELISLYPTRPVLIIGHTDGIGDAGYNKALSERRARLVRQFFIENFDIPGDRLLTRGDGEARPIASNATPAGREANRRVEVVLLD